MSDEPAAPQPLVIESYRAVFRYERRLYRIDRWRVPLPGGLPLRALLYAPAVVAALLVAERLPLLGALLALLPAPLHWGLLPLGATAALVRAQLDGRAAPAVLWSLLCWALAPRWLAGLRPCPAPGGVTVVAGVLVVRPDWRAAPAGGYPSGRVAGPARARLHAPAELVAAGPRAVQLRPAPAVAPLRTPRVLEIPAGAELRI